MPVHTTFTRPAGVAPGALILADLGDGQPFTARAEAIHWGAGLGPDGEGRVLRYRVLSGRKITKRGLHAFGEPLIGPPSARR